MGLGWPAEDCGVLSFQEHFRCDTRGNKRFRDQPSLARTVPCKSRSLLPVCPSTFGSKRPHSKNCEHQLLCLLTLKKPGRYLGLAGPRRRCRGEVSLLPRDLGSGTPRFGFGFCFLLFEFLEKRKKERKHSPLSPKKQLTSSRPERSWPMKGRAGALQHQQGRPLAYLS